MLPLRLVPDETRFRFMKMRKVAYPFSAILSVISIILFFTLGLNTGIDFRGGTLIEIRTLGGPADIADLRTRLNGLGLGQVEIQEFGAPTDVLLRLQEQPGGDAAQQAAVSQVRQALGDAVEYRRVEVVGPRVSSELAQSGAIAVLVAIIAVLIYIWVRFEWQFAVGAIIATLHDVVLTIGLFAATRMEFNLSSIAAILTIVGYSLNDTVVVYDRVRETLRRYKKMPLSDLIDSAVNSTLSRTFMTSVTTLLALLALFIFGGEVIRGFTGAMIWGVVVGTYSSIFIAAPLLLYLGLRRDSLAPAPDEAARREQPVERPV